jgi:hypothetical protein
MIKGMVAELSRRDFLKLGGALLATGALSKVPGLLDVNENVHALEESTTDVVSAPIDTDIATYYPILEFHDQKPAYTTELAKAGVFPTVLFMEMVLVESALDFQNNRDAESILYAQLGTPGNEGPTVVDAQTIMDQANYRHEIAYEAIKYPSLESKGILASLQEFVTRLAVSIDRKDKIVGNDAKNLWKLQQELSQKDPNDMLVKVRSLFIARKIQTVGKYYSDLYNRKNDVAFVVGKAHEDVLTYLESGEETTLELINQLPLEILESLVKENGGVEAFCTTVDIPVAHVVKEGKNAKNLIIDEDLQDLLKTKVV